MKTVTIGKREVKLELPPSYAVRYAICGYASHNEPYTYGAALAVCWLSGPSGKAPKTRLRKHNHNPLSFGAAVLDELIGRGVDYAEIMRAGAIAFNMLVDSLPGSDEVDEAEGNSVAEDEE